ncbi:sirohydrochlorin chelatase [Mycobacterium montefiorense]|uniref:Ferrochelatase n=1 Tax=Mycobacterium montefiorense TaxID=154654 RepID=A0AA37V4R1_9MYCO|nr:sirohydrochlorin chelatase [Mycobacterium montefiorense]GBG39905.1 ferrochelatase [Mycobacterium montefiorense]GKU36580.1 ferrochelatase [Mycobacterium montefiorense]GKU38683.1 ferrochelatase [Mycobacterium montefiorense]GKU46587.1 ferrochelatase [Mycobacterium montefiorense]GKU48854.1 ferrochelatase [Mycobacterium montefiorense]
MRVARVVTTLVLTAHGSKDARSAANARAVAGQVARLRLDLDVRLAFLDHDSPSLTDVLTALDGPAVVTPLLLANAYHARVDIPAQIASCVTAQDVWQAPVLGEDDRLVSVLRRRVMELGVSRLDDSLGVLVVAIGTSDLAVNARTGRVAPKLLAGTSWAGATTAFATQQQRSLAEGLGRLRRQGAHRVVIAPWFLAQGRLPDQVQEFADKAGIEMAAPLGAHRLVAETVLDRFAAAAAGQVAA